MTSAQKILADQNGIAVSKEAFDLLADKQIIYAVNGITKHTEEYRNNKLTFVEYYAADDENTEDILGRFAAAPVTVNIITQSLVGQYWVHTMHEFRDGHQFGSSTRYVYNAFNQIICEQDFDVRTNNPISESTEKYLYQNSTDTRHDFALGFQYKSNGQLNYVWGPWVDGTYRARKGSVYADEMDIYFPGLLAAQPYYAESRLLPTDAT
jgi:hypothetical protein